jgi:hypothetical protein
MIKFEEIYNGIKPALTTEWATGKTSNRSTFKLISLNISKNIQKATGSDIEAQFWMSKDKRNLNFEFANSKLEFKQLRVSIASSFREYIFSKEYPSWLHPSKGSTVSHVTLIDKQNDVVRSLVNEYYEFINKSICDWDSETFSGLLSTQVSGLFDSTKISEFKANAAKNRTIRRMAKTAIETVVGANGQQILRIVKNKDFGFDTQLDLEKYVTKLVHLQKGLCAITGLVLRYDDETDDSELLCSLDRIDSDGHYEAGNLQVVCRFVNRWKSNGNDAEFRRLISIIRK